MKGSEKLGGATPEDAAQERARKAFFAGQYSAAFAAAHAALLSKAIRWFREEGTVFQRPPNEYTPTELIVGLAFAAHAELHERGDDASPKLEAAATLFAAIAELRSALEVPTGDDPDATHEKLAEIVLRSAMVGQAEMIMTAIELGWLDKLAEYEMDRERRRAGAALANAKKADARQQALNQAVRIAGRNPTLSNEDLARKAVDAAGLKTTIRTATEWVRGWRKGGYLPPITAT